MYLEPGHGGEDNVSQKPERAAVPGPICRADLG